MCGGVGSGKSFAGIEEAGEMANTINPGKRGMFVLPNFDHFDDVLLPIIKEVWPPNFEIIRRGNKPKILVHCGDHGISEILLRSGMNTQTTARIDGPTVAWAFLDEPSKIKCGKSAFEKTLGRTRQPAPLNSVFCTGSPQGPNWIAESFGHTDRFPQMAWTDGISPRDDYFIMAARTRDNVHNAEGFVESLIDAYGELFALQELEGDIIAAEGRIYPNFYKNVHVIPHELAMNRFRACRKHASGHDWGWTNPGANLYAGQTSDGEFIFVDEWYHRRRQVEEQGADVALKEKELGVTFSKYADPAEPANIDKWRRGFTWKGVPYVLNNVYEAPNDWQTGCDVVRNLLHIRGVGKLDHPNVERFGPDNKLGRPSLFMSERCVNTNKEFPAYREIEIEPDKPPREGAVGEAHGLDGVRYCTFGSQRVQRPEGTRMRR
jgi:hypothetical protein